MRAGNCENLWKLWYAFLVFSAYGFLTYNAIRQYLQFKEQAYDPRYGGVWNEIPMDFYVAMLVVALTILPIFLYSALLKVGNMANDDVILGKDMDNLKLLESQPTKSKSVEAGINEASGNNETATNCTSGGHKRSAASEVWKRIRGHLLPYSCYLHVISAYALLLPLPTLQAEQIKNEALPSYHMWHSDLDFIFRPDISHPKISRISGEPIFQETLAISPEMCNFIVALTLLTVRLPNSFWFASRSFALLFSLNLLFTSVHLVFNYAALAVFYKIASNPSLAIAIEAFKKENTKENKMHMMMHDFGRCNRDGHFSVFLSPAICIGLESISFLLIILGQVGVYEYGHGQFLGNLKRYRAYLISTSNGGSSRGSSHSEDSGSETLRGESSCCYRYWTNLFSFTLLIALLILKVPLTCQFVQAYWCTREPIFFVAIILSIIYLGGWLLLWFCFTVKTSWRFHVDNNVHNAFTNPNKTFHHNQVKLNANGEPVYGCYHDNVALSHSSNSSADALARQLNNAECCSESSKASSGSRIPPDGTNYVYLQQHQQRNPHLSIHSIPTISEHVDGTASETSYDTTASRSTSNMGLVKYAPHNRPQMVSMPPYATLASVVSGNQTIIGGINSSTSNSMTEEHMIGSQSLNRANKMRRSGNRVTFKEPNDLDDLGSPDAMSSTIPSSDSGFDCGTYPGQPELQHLTGKSSRTYEDYSMFGNLFNQQSGMTSYGDIYNGHNVPYPYISASSAIPASEGQTNYLFANSIAPVPHPPGVSCVGDQEYLKVPDILMNDQGLSSSSPAMPCNFSSNNMYSGRCDMDRRMPDGSSPPSSQIEMSRSSSNNGLSSQTGSHHFNNPLSSNTPATRMQNTDQSMCSQV